MEDDSTLYLAGELVVSELLESPSRPKPVIPQVPGYRLDELLGRGSFGEVWRGIQHSSGQTVAIKLLTNAEGLDWDYFALEVRRLGQVAEHPNVVTLLAADLQHRPAYFVMACLPGTLASRAGSSAAETVAWIEQVALALRHTHARGLLHCDLKPSNILIDEDERVRVADFGQAALQGSTSQRLGSLGYMAPEQADLRSTPDVAWDIYSLGACAYFLLSGNRPRLSQTELAELSSMTSGKDRRDRYSQLLAGRPLVPLSVDRDLADIVHRCLDVDPARRPRSADDVLQDLERRRRKLPLLCRRPWSTGYRVERFLRRHALAVSFALLFLVGVLTSMGLLWSSRQSALRLAARQQFEKGWSLYNEGETALALLWWTSAASLEPGDPAFRFPLNYCPCRLVNMFELGDQVTHVALTPDGSHVLAGSGAGGFASWDLTTGERGLARPVTPQGHPQRPVLNAVALSPDGQVILAAGPSGPAELWRLSDGSHRPLGEDRWVGGEFSRDGQRVLLLGQSQAQVWKVADLSPVTPPLPMPGLLTGRLAPDASTLVLASVDQMACWSTAHPEQPHRLPIRPGIGGAAFLVYHPDGHRLATLSASGVTRIRSIPDLQPVGEALALSPALATAFSPDGGQQAVGCLDGTIHIGARTLAHPLSAVMGVGYSPDGGKLAAWGVDGSARIFDTATGEAASPTLWQDDFVTSAAFSADSTLVATGSLNGTVKIWRLGTSQGAPRVQVSRLGPNPPEGDLHFTPEGARVISVSPKSAQIWDSSTGAAVGSPLPVPVGWVGQSGDGTRLVSHGPGGIYVWDAATGRCLNDHLGPRDGSMLAILDGSGKRAALTENKHAASHVEVVEVDSGKSLGSTDCPDVRGIAFHPAGDRVALNVGSSIKVWNLKTGQVTPLYPQHLVESGMQYVNRGRQLLIVSVDGAARLVGDSDEEDSNLSVAGPVGWPVADPSGRWVAVSLGHTRIRLLDLGSGQPLLPDLVGQTAAIFGSDGRLLTISQDAVVSRWDILPDLSLSPDRLRLQAEKWTGLRLKPSGIIERLTPDQWRQLPLTSR